MRQNVIIIRNMLVRRVLVTRCNASMACNSSRYSLQGVRWRSYTSLATSPLPEDARDWTWNFLHAKKTLCQPNTTINQTLPGKEVFIQKGILSILKLNPIFPQKVHNSSINYLQHSQNKNICTHSVSMLDGAGISTELILERDSVFTINSLIVGFVAPA